MIYLDTSLVVAALTDEHASASVRRWLIAQEAGSLLVSRWVETEFASAIGLKRRRNALSASEASTALSAFKTLARVNCVVAPVSDRHFVNAAERLLRHELGLRAGDALHLAIAEDHNAILATLDSTQSEAARALGMRTISPAHF